MYRRANVSGFFNPNVRTAGIQPPLVNGLKRVQRPNTVPISIRSNALQSAQRQLLWGSRQHAIGAAVTCALKALSACT